MSNKNKKQEDRNIMNYISKIICNIYKYISQLCGFEDDADVLPDSKSSRENTKIASTNSTGSNETMVQEAAIKEQASTTLPRKPAAKRKIAAKRKKPIKKTTRKSTKKPIKKAVKKT